MYDVNDKETWESEFEVPPAAAAAGDSSDSWKTVEIPFSQFTSKRLKQKLDINRTYLSNV